MSRIGKKPVELPKGVTASMSGQTIEVKGPKGTRSFTAGDDVTITIDGTAVKVTPRGARTPLPAPMTTPTPPPSRAHSRRRARTAARSSGSSRARPSLAMPRSATPRGGWWRTWTATASRSPS